MMQPDRDQLLFELLSLWDEAPQGQKPSAEEICRNHPEMLDEVRKGIAQLQAANAALGSAPTVPSQPISRPGNLPEAIAGYRILSILGKGGMGVVYEAEQRQPRRRVALKVIGASFVTPELLRRFNHEANLLARLKHAGIAQIYEAGEAPTPHGPQPFFAMELVDGTPIDQYIEQHKLDYNARLELVHKLCEAVAYAHQQGVIHRDLKPSNIFVTTDGQPKILDFGVARATEKHHQAMTLQTTAGQIVGTLAYMSPEQASGLPEEIDERSDVYALGVITYELLSGKLPYDLSTRTLADAVRMIREIEPARLSGFDRTLRGDVETIVAKAMAKEKHRRYDTAIEFAEDIRRYLSHEPISARPASALYQLTKFARRENKTIAAGLAGTLVVLAIAIFLIHTIQNRNALREKKQWELQQRDRATLAIQRGAWSEAEQILRVALEHGYSDPLDLQLDLIRCLEGDQQLAAAQKLADELAARPPGPRRAEIIFWQGQLKWVSDAPVARQKLDLARKAGSGLPDAHRHFANAMLAETVPEAISELQQCLEADAYFHSAKGTLTFLLTIMGRYEDARTQAIVWQQAYPKDNTPVMFQAVIASCQGRVDDAKQLYRRASQPEPDERVAKILEELPKIMNIDNFTITPMSELMKTAFTFQSLLSKSSGSMPPIPSCFGNAPQELLKLVLRGKLTSPEEMIAPLEDFCRRMPTGLSYYVKGNALMAIERYAESFEAMTLAAETPSPLNVHRAAMEDRVFSAAGIWSMKGAKDEDTADINRLRNAVHDAMAAGGFRGGKIDLSMIILLRLRELQVAREVIESRRKASGETPAHFLDLARVEYLSGNFSAAISNAQQVLKTDPNEATATLIVKRSQAHIEQRFIGEPEDVEGIAPARIKPTTQPTTQSS